MGIVIALFIAAFVVSLFLMSHPTCVIARKTRPSDTAEVLARIPDLQLIPMIWAADGTVWQVLVPSAAGVLSLALPLSGLYLANHVDEGSLEGVLAEWREAAMAEIEAMECWSGRARAQRPWRCRPSASPLPSGGHGKGGRRAHARRSVDER